MLHAAGLTVADLCGTLCTSQKGVLRLSNLKACKIAHMPITGSHLRLVCFGYQNSLITKRYFGLYETW